MCEIISPTLLYYFNGKKQNKKTYLVQQLKSWMVIDALSFMQDEKAK